MHQRGNTELPCRGPLLKIAQYCDTHPTVISSAARSFRERTDLAESRNLLFCRVQQQVPRLHSAIRDADDGTPLGMTDRVGVSRYSANLNRQLESTTVAGAKSTSLSRPPVFARPDSRGRLSPHRTFQSTVRTSSGSVSTNSHL